MAARGEDIEWAIKILAEAKDRLKGQTASQERAAPGNAASRRGTVDGKSLRDLERENARLRAELHMLRQNLETPGDEQVKGEAGVVRMRRHTSCKLSEAVTETISKDGVDGSVAGPGEPELRGRDGTVVRLPRPRAKAECKLVVCTDRHGCEFIRPGPRGIRTSQHSTNQVKLVWDEQPRRALIVKKPHDADSRGALVCIARYLVDHGVAVMVEPVVADDLRAAPSTRDIEVETWRKGADAEVHSLVDFVVCLGGDGTTLWASHLFPRAVPPVISFAMGSLGFLTQFNAGDFAHHLRSLLAGNVDVSLRSRLMVRLHRASVSGPAEDASVNEYFERDESYETVLNEVVIDRAAHSGLADLDVFCNGVFVTKVLADGVILATCTGSTAYSLSAGGSMVHPSLPAVLLTPICPHTLSFRPLILSDSATIRIQIPLSTRCKGTRVATDGRNLCELAPGDAIVIKMSPFPVPAVCYRTENKDWFSSVTTNLKWNVRETQKPFEPSPSTPSPPDGAGESGAASRGSDGAMAPRANM